MLSIHSSSFFWFSLSLGVRLLIVSPYIGEWVEHSAVVDHSSLHVHVPHRAVADAAERCSLRRIPSALLLLCSLLVNRTAASDSLSDRPIVRHRFSRIVSLMMFSFSTPLIFETHLPVCVCLLVQVHSACDWSSARSRRGRFGLGLSALVTITAPFDAFPSRRTGAWLVKFKLSFS